MVSKEFANDIFNAVSEAFPDYTFILKDVNKNNNVVLTALTYISDKKISPCIYLDGMSGKTMEEIVEYIGTVIDSEEPQMDINNIVSVLSDEDKLLSLVMPKLVNSEQNLEDYIYSDFVEGLSVLYYIPIKMDNEFNGSITLLKHHEAFLPKNITADKLFKAALTNIKQEVNILNLGQVLHMPTNNPIFVVSNTRRYYGAGAMIDTSAFEYLSESADDDLFIIPSSIHEVLTLPASLGDSTAILGMITEINRTIVGNTDVLSNNLYRYNCKTKTITKEEN